ncbi:MAG: DUF5009 domain-containing protein [Coriobacteriia bacterium]|nr:DUF5009 domain-containing protein [Coriobacteriia bacterium]
MKNRILSLDILRGIVMFAMVIVNIPTGKMYPFLLHSEVFGLTLADMIFPAFLTICGVSLFFSLSKFNFRFTKKSFIKILKRFILLLIVSYLMYWICNIITGLFDGQKLIEVALDFSKFRICGVLQRIAVACFLASLIILLIKNKKTIISIIVIMILGYSLILIFGSGLSNGPENILKQIDVSVFGEAHLYTEINEDGTKNIFDPEGLISTIFCTSQVLIGFLVAKSLKEKDSLKLFVSGFSLMIIGFIYSFFIPIGKIYWTPSYMLMTTGITVCCLALLCWIVDIKGYKKWGKFFEIFGKNALTIYVLSQIFYFILAGSCISTYGNNLFLSICGIPELASLIFCILFALFMWLISFVLYKFKIFIKL